MLVCFLQISIDFSVRPAVGLHHDDVDFIQTENVFKKPPRVHSTLLPEGFKRRKTKLETTVTTSNEHALNWLSFAARNCPHQKHCKLSFLGGGGGNYDAASDDFDG